jgi:hypothetical protein
MCYSNCMTRFLAAVTITLVLLGAVSAEAETHRPELGQVRWNRDLDEALRLSARRDTPVFILFQEVPGCSTCVSYGELVLTHPLIVEAIETLFIPLVVFNNHPGKDLETMKLFGEPRWNNPVVRIVDSRRRDVTRRLAGNYSVAGTAGAMIDALEASGTAVPMYLRIVHEERGALAPVDKAVAAALSESPYRYLPLTPLQAKKVGRALSRGNDPGRFLSPRQTAMLAYIEVHPEAKVVRVRDRDFVKAWEELSVKTAQ